MKSLVEWSRGNRERLLQVIKKTLQDPLAPWALVLVNDYENHKERFRSESSFFYLTGIHEPAIAVVIYSDGRQVLYRPAYSIDRESWTGVRFNPEELGFPEVKYLGDAIKGYSISGVFKAENYKILGEDLALWLNTGGSLFVLHDVSGGHYKTQSELLSMVVDTFGISYKEVRDVSPLLHELRREKSVSEIALMYDAAQVTIAAHKFVAKAIKSGAFEYELRAGVESVFALSGAERPAFPTIVGSGLNSTRLHYTQGGSQLMDGDLVVIDCGAEYRMYCADVTRTYPVSGMFTPRQKEIYELVLRVQKTLELLVKPGMFLRNADFPDLSLHHLAVKMFKDAGVEKYFTHSIGHYLGLDVHDVGDYSVPLCSGDAFTLEPGLYFPEERLGIRIEDDYVLADDGLICLSEDLPKEADDIEALLAEKVQGFNLTE
ncbi:M24 family metallopeptidase [Candidatus Dependentiae bacterium]|nr:M24 family metallopeptidase [Candidatus Dependentiae bacterium]